MHPHNVTEYILFNLLATQDGYTKPKQPSEVFHQMAHEAIIHEKPIDDPKVQSLIIDYAIAATYAAIQTLYSPTPTTNHEKETI